jgi:hypothetical protein
MTDEGVYYVEQDWGLDLDDWSTVASSTELV